jgi:UDP-glucose 4-epimerase
LAFEVMARATFDLLELCVKHTVKRVIAASSASIYGLSDQFPTHENVHPYNNRTLYGAFKCMNEGLLRSFNDMYGLNYAATRYFNVYGPRMDIHGKYTEVLIRWMERIDQGLSPVIFGDGLQTMDFIHVRDIARFNVLLAKSSCVDEVYNVARGEEISLVQLAQCLLQVMGRTDLKIDYQAERSINPVQRRLADVTKSHHDLGFSAEITLEKGLAGLVEWWRENRSIGQMVQ